MSPLPYRIGLVIPFFNHGQFALQLLQNLVSYQLPIIIVNDGSDSNHSNLLLQAVAHIKQQGNKALHTPDITVIHHTENQGKGGAVMTGFYHAQKQGLTHIIQVDADCQHDLSQIPIFMQSALEHPQSVICGYPQYDASVPKSRLYPRYITHIWVWINTLSFTIKDSMCGFRCYPVNTTINLFQCVNIGTYMDFDIDVIVRLYWKGLNIVNIPVSVIYHQEPSSHFRVWKDNVLISKTHARLFAGMLWRSPSLILRHLHKGTIKHRKMNSTDKENA